MNINDDQLTDKAVANADCTHSEDSSTEVNATEVSPAEVNAAEIGNAGLSPTEIINASGFTPDTADTVGSAPTRQPEEGSDPLSPTPLLTAGEGTDGNDSPACAPAADSGKSGSDLMPDSDELRRRLEKVEREAYARGRAEAVDEYLNPNPFFRGLHGTESAVATDPDLQRILSTRNHVW